MFSRYSLRSKLVLAITGMVFAVVVTLSSIYVSQLVKQKVNDASNSGDFIAHQIFHLARKALEEDLSDSQLDLNNPDILREAAQESLQRDDGVNSLLEAVVGYSPTIWDAAIADEQGRALLHTDPDLIGKKLALRDDFARVKQGGILEQLRMVYGKPKVYSLSIPLERNDKPFGAVRVGISSVLLKSELQPQLNRALLFSGVAIVVSMFLAAVLSNFALRPLFTIGRQLDRVASGDTSSLQVKELEGDDEVSAVTQKIDKIGRQMRDVKEVFSALKENLDQIMANLQDGLMLFTKDSRAVLVSASIERFLGRPRAEVLGEDVSHIFDRSSEIGRAVLSAFENQQPLLQQEITDEENRRVQVSLDFIEEGGEGLGALLTLRDTESVHKIEDEIEVSRRLAAIGRLTSGVAHEVKNPINAIVVHLEVLRTKLRELDPDSRRHMDIIGSEIRRLDRVVHTLVDFYRPVDLKLTDVDLRKLVEDVVTLASPDIEKQGIVVERQDAPEPLMVKVDADLMKQALLNVVINAVQAMPNGGILRVVTRHDDGEATIEVRDQGRGIPSAVRDKIFNLYFTTKKEGSGIGLAMTYRVLQLHNGSVEFDSQEGLGTTFRMKLPMIYAERRPNMETAVKTSAVN